jgi:hypothetical protein
MTEAYPMGPEANYDINVYNRGADQSSILPADECYDEWILCFYEIDNVGDGYGTGREREELNLKLTDEEVKDLTLGFGPDLGGDYTEDDDFWLDKNSFLDMYKVIPPRVREYLDNLPPY